MYFGRIVGLILCILAGLRSRGKNWYWYVASENPEFGTTLSRLLNQSRASAVLQSNLIAIKFGRSTTSELDQYY